MRPLLELLGRLRDREDGVAALEFCLTLPILLGMTLGAYDISRLIVARLDYHQALTEAAGLAIAQPAQGINTDYMASVVAGAADVPTSAVSVQTQLECDGAPVSDNICPANGDERALFVSLTINTSYEPTWRHFSVDRTIPLNLTRVIRIQ